MSVIEFKPRVKPAVPANHWKWNCGECESETFVIWGDGVVCCAKCNRQASGMTAKVVP